MATLVVGLLPQNALDAAAVFHADALPRARAALVAPGDDLALVFGPASPEHRGWRLAAVQQLARDHAPRRVNAIEGDGEQAIAAALAFLEQAPGLTGQLLKLDGNGADALLSSRS
jgi:hypothetical protein